MDPTGDVEISVSQALAGVFILGLAVGFSAGILAPVSVSGDTGSTETVNNPNSQDSGSSAPSTVAVKRINNTYDPVLGNEDAKVTVVMYEDFQCPFCRRFETKAVPRIVKNYVRSGEVKLVWKDFPLQRIHPWAIEAAVTMECVQRQNETAFWNVKDRVFQNQRSLSSENIRKRIKSWAAEEGISRSAVESCMENSNPQKAVQQDLREGQSFKAVVGGDSFVSGTPSAVVYGEGDSRGKPIVGAQPYSVFRKAIEKRLDG